MVHGWAVEALEDREWEDGEWEDGECGVEELVVVMGVVERS